MTLEVSKPRQNLNELARQLGIWAELIYRWRSEFLQKGEGSFPGHGKLKHTFEEVGIVKLKKQLRELEMERGILKKLSVSFPREAGNLPVYSRAQGQIFPPEKICKVFQVNRSSYYTYLAGAVSQRAQANKNLLAMIKEVHQKSKQHYGSPRIQQVLKAHKMQVFRSRVACLMQQAGASGNEEKKI